MMEKERNNAVRKEIKKEEGRAGEQVHVDIRERGDRRRKSRKGKRRREIGEEGRK